MRKGDYWKVLLGRLDFTLTEDGRLPDMVKASRPLTCVEAFHLLRDQLLFPIPGPRDFESREEFEVFRDTLTEDVNDWLTGKASDGDILSYDSRDRCNCMTMVEHLLVYGFLKTKKIV